MDFQKGQTLLIDKPKGWTSFDVVAKVRNAIRQYAGAKVKVGHAGTLDPLATGLLILCTGKHTKIIEQYQGLPKTYEVIFKLGATTASYDGEHPEENQVNTDHLDQASLEAGMRHFEGEIEQTPPVFSAVKVGGKRAYESARKGQRVELKTRRVHITHFRLLEFQNPAWIRAEVGCSKGTYIRSLVHDLGQHLGVGGYILELKRTAIGEFELSQAQSVADFVDHLLPPNPA